MTSIQSTAHSKRLKDINLTKFTENIKQHWKTVLNLNKCKLNQDILSA